MAICACGCGGEMNEGSKWKYLRGHKPKPEGGAKKRSTPPLNGKGTALARRQAEIVIDAPEDGEAESEDGDAAEYVSCEISVTQLDKVYAMLSPQAKAMAVLNGLNEEG